MSVPLLRDAHYSIYSLLKQVHWTHRLCPLLVRSGTFWEGMMGGKQTKGNIVPSVYVVVILPVYIVWCACTY